MARASNRLVVNAHAARDWDERCPYVIQTPRPPAASVPPRPLNRVGHRCRPPTPIGEGGTMTAADLACRSRRRRADERARLVLLRAHRRGSRAIGRWPTSLVRGGYSPSVVRVRAGQPVRLRFDRQDNSGCTARVVCLRDEHAARNAHRRTRRRRRRRGRPDDGWRYHDSARAVGVGPTLESGPRWLVSFVFRHTPYRRSSP